MNRKKIISVLAIIVVLVLLLLVFVLVWLSHPFAFSPTLPKGIYQGTLSSASPPQLAQPEANASVSLVWAITVSSSVYSGLSLPNGTVIYLVSSANITSYSDFLIDLSSYVSEGLRPPTLANALPEVVSFSGIIFAFRDYENHLCYGLDNAKIMPPVAQPA